MEKGYDGSNILLLESGVHSKSLQICTAVFTICGGSNIWQDLEYTGRVSVNFLYRISAHVKKISLLRMHSLSDSASTLFKIASAS